MEKDKAREKGGSRERNLVHATTSGKEDGATSRWFKRGQDCGTGRDKTVGSRKRDERNQAKCVVPSVTVFVFKL